MRVFAARRNQKRLREVVGDNWAGVPQLDRRAPFSFLKKRTANPSSAAGKGGMTWIILTHLIVRTELNVMPQDGAPQHAAGG